MNEEYDQPGFYRFNEDSIRLVSWILEQDLTPENILDLGAGCGVIGIELARSLKPKGLTLLEVQKEFLSSLELNCRKFLHDITNYSIYIESFFNFSPICKYDLIVSNPPYYLPGRGEMAHDPNRAVARSFLIDSWSVLLNKILVSLSKEGRAFVVLKNNNDLMPPISQVVFDLGLGLETHKRDSIMILELFRLHKN
jgi:tRNA1(Val) A37 N6-methylase TrmN6